MKSIKRPNQYLRLRQDIWHYVRRVPKAVEHVEGRAVIHRSLDTDTSPSILPFKPSYKRYFIYPNAIHPDETQKATVPNMTMETH